METVAILQPITTSTLKVDVCMFFAISASAIIRWH